MFWSILFFVIIAIWLMSNFREIILNIFDDPMKYPFHSKFEILRYKALASKYDYNDKSWDRMLKNMNKRRKNEKEILIITNAEYDQISQAMEDGAKREFYSEYYKSMIMDNFSIINGKKTFEEVEGSCLCGWKNHTEKAREYREDWLKRNNCVYKI